MVLGLVSSADGIPGGIPQFRVLPSAVSMYVAACSVCRLNVPENTPIQSITRSARAD